MKFNSSTSSFTFLSISYKSTNLNLGSSIISSELISLYEEIKSPIYFRLTFTELKIVSTQ